MTIVRCKGCNDQRGETLHLTMINNMSERVHKFTQHCLFISGGGKAAQETSV